MRYGYIFFLLLGGFIVPLSGQGQREQIPPLGGGGVSMESGECLSSEDRGRIMNEISANMARLTAEGKIKKSSTRTLLKHNFIRPLHQLNENEYGDVVVSINQVDHDNSTGVLDYNCMAQTYDGHQGTDFGLWPFPWYFYDHNLMEVIAAEDGVIIGKDDGNFDQNCSCIGAWNAVYLLHSDGLITWYGHLKKGLLTSKAVGDSVKQGEFLGYVGSSGCSSFPHLHFEVHGADGALVDPYKGTCNEIEESYWGMQPEYFDTRVTSVRTHISDPVHGCPSINEFARFADTFDIGDYVYTAAYYSDQMKGDEMIYRIYDSENNLWKEWSAVADSFYQVAWWYWGNYLPLNVTGGNWRFEVEYYGKKYNKDFFVNDFTNADKKGDRKKEFRIYPNPSSDEVMIAGQDIEQITITDLLGRVISPDRWDHATGKIDVSTLPKGLYMTMPSFNGRP